MYPHLIYNPKVLGRRKQYIDEYVIAYCITALCFHS